MAKKENFFSDDIDYLNNSNEGDMFENSYDVKPNNMDYDSFQLRTNPTPILEELRMELMRKTKKYHKDGSLKDAMGRYDLIQIPNTKPMANALGVEEIIMSVRKIFNNHVVQGNTVDQSHHKEKMRYVADMLTIIFWTKRKDWGLNLNDVNQLIGTITTMSDYFLSRTIGNEERKAYTEAYKENTSREIRNSPSRPNMFSRMFSSFRR